jgi:hypothetical protein
MVEWVFDGECGQVISVYLVFVFACLVNGATVSKNGYYMLWYLAAGIFTTADATLMSIVSEHMSCGVLTALELHVL